MNHHFHIIYHWLHIYTDTDIDITPPAAAYKDADPWSFHLFLHEYIDCVITIMYPCVTIFMLCSSPLPEILLFGTSSMHVCSVLRISVSSFWLKGPSCHHPWVALRNVHAKSWLWLIESQPLIIILCTPQPKVHVGGTEALGGEIGVPGDASEKLELL